MGLVFNHLQLSVWQCTSVNILTKNCNKQSFPIVFEPVKALNSNPKNLRDEFKLPRTPGGSCYSLCCGTHYPTYKLYIPIKNSIFVYWEREMHMCVWRGWIDWMCRHVWPDPPAWSYVIVWTWNMQLNVISAMIWTGVVHVVWCPQCGARCSFSPLIGVELRSDKLLGRKRCCPEGNWAHPKFHERECWLLFSNIKEGFYCLK